MWPQIDLTLVLYILLFSYKAFLMAIGSWQKFFDTRIIIYLI